jgi:hypothetical protein
MVGLPGEGVHESILLFAHWKGDDVLAERFSLKRRRGMGEKKRHHS